MAKLVRREQDASAAAVGPAQHGTTEVSVG
jgi:hypothetical protein